MEVVEPLPSAVRQPPRPPGPPAPPTTGFAPRPAPRPPGRQRQSLVEFLREVVAELRAMAWPRPADTTQHSAVVLLALAVLMAVVFVADLAGARLELLLLR